MRTVDERIAAVRSRSARLRWKRGDRLLGAFACTFACTSYSRAGILVGL